VKLRHNWVVMLCIKMLFNAIHIVMDLGVLFLLVLLLGYLNSSGGDSSSNYLFIIWFIHTLSRSQ